MALEDYPFHVERMGPHGEIGHVLVYADDLILARAAFKAAVQQWPASSEKVCERFCNSRETRPATP
jgi:hypothetical protein